MHCNLATLAEIFGVARSTITNWQVDGLPAVEEGTNGKAWVFDTAEVVVWWAENKSRRRQRSETPDGVESYEDAERRKMVAAADRAELELAKGAGRVVLIEDVAAIITEMHVRVRTRLTGIGTSVRIQAKSLFSGDRQAEERVVKAVEDIVGDAIAELRDDPFASGDDDSGADAE